MFFMKQIYFGKNYTVESNICSWLIFKASEI